MARRDLVNLDQMSLIEPDGPEALRLMEYHAGRFEKATQAAVLWESRVCLGARDEALRQADEAYRSWLVCAIFLDLERAA